MVFYYRFGIKISRYVLFNFYIHSLICVVTTKCRTTAAMSKFNIFGADSAVPNEMGTALSAPKMLNFDMAAVETLR